jgi:hypothetical protein
MLLCARDRADDGAKMSPCQHGIEDSTETPPNHAVHAPILLKRRGRHRTRRKEVPKIVISVKVALHAASRRTLGSH